MSDEYQNKNRDANPEHISSIIARVMKDLTKKASEPRPEPKRDPK